VTVEPAALVEPPLSGFGARIPQPIRFLVVGGFNTLLSLAVFAAFDRIVPYLLALLISHVITVVVAFILQRYVVFHVRGNVLIDLTRFESVYLAQAIYLAVSAVVTYILHKNFSFKR